MSSFSSYVIGGNTLLIACCQKILEGGHQIRGVISADQRVLQWLSKHAITSYHPKTPYLGAMASEPFDFLFSIANLSLVPQAALELPLKGAINFHDGPLPRYAGLNAPAWALMAGEQDYAVSWHYMTREFDQGPILKQSHFKISPAETSLSLNIKCVERGLNSFGELLEEIADDRQQSRPQDLRHFNYFGRHQRPAGACMLDFHKPAIDLVQMIRALNFGPYENPLGSPKLGYGKQLVIVREASVRKGHALPGSVVSATDETLEVGTGEGHLVITQITSLFGEKIEFSQQQQKAGDQLFTIEQSTTKELTSHNQELAHSEQFWSRRLASVVPIELPFTGGGSARLEASTQHVPQLPQSLDTSERSIQTTIAAAFCAFLGRSCGLNRIHLSYSYPELRRSKLAYAWISPEVPLRVSFQDQTKFGAFLKQVDREIDRLHKHKTWLLDLVARRPELVARPELRENRLFTVAIHLHTESEEMPSRPRAGLTLCLSPTGSSHLLVRADHYSPEKAANLVRYFSHFLSGLTQVPAVSMSQLSLIDDAEKERLLHHWNRTEQQYRSEIRVHQLFEEQVAASPDAEALVFRHRVLTFTELNQRANRLARQLRTHAVAADDLVGIHLRRGPELVIAMLAIQKAGGAYLPLDPDFPTERIKYMIQDSQVGIIISELGSSEDLPSSVHKIVQDREQTANGRKDNLNLPGHAHNIAYVIYTSGSTGKPKGVMVPHRNVVHLFKAMEALIPHQGGTWLAVTSLSFDISVLELVWTLTHGIKVVLYEDAKLEGGHLDLARLVTEHQVTHLQCTPSMAQLMTSNQELTAALAKIKHVFVGGEALHPMLARKLDENGAELLLNLYGPTETTIWTTCQQIVSTTGTVPIGKPIANTQVYVLDRRLNPLPQGEAGELYIAGDGVTRGYRQRPSLTATCFVPDPFGKQSTRMYRSGDLVCWQQDGTLAFLGRLDSQVKLRGYRIELGEIEYQLASHQAVKRAVVLARQDQPYEKRLVAYLEGEPPSDRELRNYLGKLLPSYMVPSHFVEMESFPLTPNHKIDRKALDALGTGLAKTKANYAPPKNELESKIASIWLELLARGQVGIDDNFFDIGGHSLQVLNMHRQLEALLDRSIPLTDMYRFTTIRTLASSLASGDNRNEKLKQSAKRAHLRRAARRRR